MIVGLPAFIYTVSHVFFKKALRMNTIPHNTENQTASYAETKTPRWQHQLHDRFHDVASLLTFLDLTGHPKLDADHEQSNFPLFVPRCYAQKMRRGDPSDPLLLEILPRQLERQEQPGFVKDPLNEQDANPVPGLLHKYKGRVLLTLNAACAVHCRYCFRRHYDYPKQTLDKAFSKAWLSYIQTHTDIHEVIFSGGDPMMLPDAAWATWVEALSTIPHLRTLRIHSRMPAVLPERISSDWCNIMAQSPLNKVMVLHVNHPNALDDAVAKACLKMRKHNITLLNQAVLLRDINDTVSIQCALQTQLFAFGVLPYYLHLLDPVAGASHFDMPLNEARTLHQGMKKNLPGYLVPRLVRETPGVLHKSWA